MMIFCEIHQHSSASNVIGISVEHGQKSRIPFLRNQLFLMEVACSENSVLTQEALRQVGDRLAQRFSLHNGYDLTTSEGVQKLKKAVRDFKPVHLWISRDCGPSSPLQRLNQRTPEQREASDKKREYAVKQYEGAIDVAKFAHSLAPRSTGNWLRDRMLGSCGV